MKKSKILSDVSEIRVLQVLPRLNAGGVERGTIDLALALKAEGLFNIVASAGGGRVVDLERARIPHFKLPLASKNLWSLWRNSHRLVKLIRQHNITLIHARSRAPAWSSRWAARKAGIKFVTTYHAAYGQQNFLKRWYNKVMTSGERVIAISRYIENHIFKIYPACKEKVRLIHRGVDCTLFDPSRVPTERLINLVKEWSLPTDKPIIMCPSRLTRLKGHEILLKSLAKLKDLDFCCVILGKGSGTYQKYLHTLVRQLSLEGRVYLVGDCNAMASAYMLADVVVHPTSYPEAFGRIIAEAQAMGRPVVATSLGGPTEIILDQITGWLIPPGDTEALATAVRQALSLTFDQRSQLAKTARDHILENFNNKTMCRKTIDLYKELMSETEDKA